MGEADLFLTRRLDSTWMNWSEPKNLGTLINTEKGEGYLSIDAAGKWAYFVSLRKFYWRQRCFQNEIAR
jgi:hypothetical protein